MKKAVKFLFILSISVAISPTAYAQIPVTDSAAISKSVQQQVETMAKWKAQYDQMTTSIDQMKAEYQALTGARNLGDIFNNPQFRDYIPADWQGVYDSVRDGGYSVLSGRAAQVYNENKVFDSCQGLSEQRRIQCEAMAVKPSQDKAFALEAYDNAKGRLDQINQLMGEINNTQDPKAIAELQGRIAAEQAAIANEETKFQLYKMVADAEDRVQIQRAREMSMEDAAKRGGLEIQPMTFSIRN